VTTADVVDGTTDTPFITPSRTRPGHVGVPAGRLVVAFEAGDAGFLVVELGSGTPGVGAGETRWPCRYTVFSGSWSCLPSPSFASVPPDEDRPGTLQPVRLDSATSTPIASTPVRSRPTTASTSAGAAMS
jgi:hypothetical protein